MRSMRKKNSKFKGIYISGPMSGVPAWEKVDSFMRAEMHLKEMFPDTRIINPIHLNGFGKNLTYEEYMEIDLMLIDNCDAIYMLKGWQQSLGCNREYGYATAKDMIVLEQEKGI
ncbi:MAG: DUF4406 domain-containing protein [Lachnospiraceae bacterium]|nr:DUF4406 domain-containing protein [Lachnospiraceae bacterium]